MFPRRRRGALAAARRRGAGCASCAAQAPPEAARPAPPSPAERAYIVFFEWGSATIGPRGRQIVAEAARNAGGERGDAAASSCRPMPTVPAGPSRNQRLSERRAEAVAAELVRQGVRRERITIRAHGENRAFVPTRDGEREAQNRGVWIVLR